jgi:hypothetical protein
MVTQLIYIYIYKPIDEGPINREKGNTFETNSREENNQVFVYL